MIFSKISNINLDQTRQKLLTERQMRDTEQRAISSGIVTGLSMMETAGRGVVDALLRAYPHYRHGGHNAVVLCGPGNNGGDGYVIAQLLRKLDWEVSVFQYGNLETLPADAAKNARLWLDSTVTEPLSVLKSGHIAGSDVVIDALFGTGLARPLAADIIGKLDMVANHAKTIIAVDIPSGVSADTGQMLRTDQPENPSSPDLPQCVWPKADQIVTFQRLKPGHLFYQAVNTGGTKMKDTDPKLSLVDLGIESFEPTCGTDKDGNICEGVIHSGGFPPGLSKPNLAHKYQHGHALVFAGGVGQGGAGRLAARAALRVGAGAVTLACPPAALTENAAQLNAVMLTSVATVSDLEKLLGDTRKNALCLGPGMGRSQATRSLICAALKSNRPIVLDADALTSFEDDPQSMFARLHNQAILTPHSGEFARLFPDLVTGKGDADSELNGLESSKIEMARRAAQIAGCPILLKGAVTIIAAPDGRIELSAAIGNRRVPWLATAGAGDVLAGFITGLLARGFDPFEAAKAAAWLHVECARTFGPGLIAEDLPDMLPRVLSNYEATM